MQVTTKYWIGFDPTYANEVNQKATAERKQVRVVSTTHGFIYKVGNIPIGGLLSVQSASRNAWISRPLVVTVLLSCLSTQASVNLCRSALPGLDLNSPQWGKCGSDWPVVYVDWSEVVPECYAICIYTLGNGDQYYFHNALSILDGIVLLITRLLLKIQTIRSQLHDKIRRSGKCA